MLRPSPTGRRWLARAVAVALLGWTANAAGQAHLVEVACPQLTPEQTAEVEARVRADLLVWGVDAQKVALSCEGQLATAEVEAGSERARRSFVIAGPDIRDSLVEGVEAALRELSRSGGEGGAVPPAASKPGADVSKSASDVAPVMVVGPAASGAQPRETPAETSPPPQRRRSAVQARALGTVELWPDALALGALLGVGYATPALYVGLHGGFAVATPSQADFDVSEWNGALDVAWQPAFAFGIRGQLGLGLSLLDVSPHGDATPRADTAARAWFAEAALSRPVRVGPLALVPSLGVRLFAASRTVNVSDQQQFELGGLVPSFGLGLEYARELAGPATAAARASATSR